MNLESFLSTPTKILTPEDQLLLKELWQSHKIEKIKEEKEFDSFLKEYGDHLKKEDKEIVLTLWKGHQEKIKKQQFEQNENNYLDQYLEENNVYPYYQNVLTFFQRVLDREFHIIQDDGFFLVENGMQHYIFISGNLIAYTAKRYITPINNDLFLKLNYWIPDKSMSKFSSYIIEGGKRNKFVLCDIQTTKYYKRLENIMIDIGNAIQTDGIKGIQKPAYKIIRKNALKGLMNK